MAESNSTEQNTTENQGFVIPQANEATQQATTAVTQTAQAVGIPTIQEQTGSRDLAIGGGIIVVLLIAFFFAKQGFTNSLVKKRVSPSKASIAGWWLFIFLSAIAIGAVLAAVGGVVFLGTLGQFLLSRQGLIMQMIEVWGNGGC